MMIVETLEHVDMQCNGRRRGKRFKHVRDHFARQLANHFPFQSEVHVRKRPAGNVHDDAGKRLVQRGVCMTEPPDALGVAESLLEAAAEHDSHILCRVVVADMEIALAFQFQRPAAVLGQSVEHVVQEADAGVDRDLLVRRVDAQRQRAGNVRLFRFAGQRARARLGSAVHF